MRTRYGLLVPLFAVALLTGCGGSGTSPETATITPPPPATGANAVTISPFDSTGTDSTSTDLTNGQPIFPAPDPRGVLALAAQHPDGRIVYATILDGTQGELIIARLGNRGLIATTRDAKTVRVGIDLTDSSIVWVCVTTGADTPKCRNHDFESEGANALASAALLVGEDHVRQIAARVASTSDGTLDVQTRANKVDASCLRGTDTGVGNLLVCVSPSGFVTDTEEGATIARASEVSPAVDPAELNPAGIG